MPRYEAPRSPLVNPLNVTAKRDDSGQFVPIIYLTWIQLPDSKADNIFKTTIFKKNNQIISVKLLFWTKHVHLAQLFSHDNSNMTPS